MYRNITHTHDCIPIADEGLLATEDVLQLTHRSSEGEGSAQGGINDRMANAKIRSGVMGMPSQDGFPGRHDMQCSGGPQDPMRDSMALFLQVRMASSFFYAATVLGRNGVARLPDRVSETTEGMKGPVVVSPCMCDMVLLRHCFVKLL